MVSKLRLMDFLETGINGGEGVRIQEFRQVKSSRMGFKLITYNVTYFDNRDGLSTSCFQAFSCVPSFFHPPHVPLGVVLLQQCARQSRG